MDAQDAYFYLMNFKKEIFHTSVASVMTVFVACFLSAIK